MRQRVLIGGGLALLALLTAWRVPVWVDDLALWQNAAQVYPTDARSLINLAVQIQIDGNDVDAARIYADAAKSASALSDGVIIDAPAAAVAYLDLATVYANTLRWEDAHQALMWAHHYNPLLHYAKLERDVARAIE